MPQREPRQSEVVLIGCGFDLERDENSGSWRSPSFTGDINKWLGIQYKPNEMQMQSILVVLVNPNFAPKKTRLLIEPGLGDPD
jgi:hypothetical protein